MRWDLPWWCVTAASLKPLRRRAPNQNLNLDLYREIPRYLSFLIWWILGVSQFQWKLSYVWLLHSCVSFTCVCRLHLCVSHSLVCVAFTCVCLIPSIQCWRSHMYEWVMAHIWMRNTRMKKSYVWMSHGTPRGCWPSFHSFIQCGAVCCHVLQRDSFTCVCLDPIHKWMSHIVCVSFLSTCVCLIPIHRHTSEWVTLQHRKWVTSCVSHSYSALNSFPNSRIRHVTRGGGLGSRPKKMYGERLGDGVEYHLMKPTPRR